MRHHPLIIEREPELAAGLAHSRLVAMYQSVLRTSLWAECKQPARPCNPKHDELRQCLSLAGRGIAYSMRMTNNRESSRLNELDEAPLTSLKSKNEVVLHVCLNGAQTASFQTLFACAKETYEASPDKALRRPSENTWR